MSTSRVFSVLVLVEFEVRCLAGNPESQLTRFVDEASSQEAVGARSLLAMGKIAVAVSSRRVAIHCLQRYLRVFVGARGVADYAQCAPAYREMITLHASRNESFPVYQGILHLLGGGGGGTGICGGVTDGIKTHHPQDEVAWLVATAWNNGTHFHRLQQYTWAERWMSKSLALAKFCPGVFDENEMLAHHAECLKHCHN